VASAELYANNYCYCYLLFRVTNWQLHCRLISPARLLKAGLQAICSAAVSSVYILGDSCQTNYLKIYLTNNRRILRVSRTMAIDGPSEIRFSIPEGTLPWQPIFLSIEIQRLCLSVALSTERTCRTHVAFGAARRANVRLCPASSLANIRMTAIVRIPDHNQRPR